MLNTCYSHATCYIHATYMLTCYSHYYMAPMYTLIAVHMSPYITMPPNHHATKWYRLQSGQRTIYTPE